MALQVCDLAYRLPSPPALRVNQLSVSFTSTLNLITAEEQHLTVVVICHI